MHSLIKICLNSIQGSHFAPLFLDASLKSVVVLAVAGGVCLCWRRASAATRHLIWFLAVAGLPFLPWLSSVLPSWQRPLWSVSTGFDSGNQFSLSLEAAPAAGSGIVPRRTPAPGTASPVRADGVPAGGARRIGVHFNASWLLLAFVAWSGGVLSVLLGLAAGRLRLRKLSRQARILQSDGWTALMHELCEELRIRRPVLLMQSADDTMPMTWRWWRPVVLLPAEASRWSEDRQRVVLRHELAHVKRWDCLTQLITGVVCACYWFNPLVWLAARRMCVERELACDDLVLNGGHAASDYASHLVEIASTFRRVPQVTAIAMARSSGLERRVAAIVDASRARHLRPVSVAAVLILVGGLIFCVGGCKTGTLPGGRDNSSSLREQQIVRLEAFSKLKEKQSQTLAAAAGEGISPEFQRFFDAATQGDWRTVTNMYASFKQRHPQYSTTNSNSDIRLRTSYWGPVLEISLAYDYVADCEPKYTQIAVDDIVDSIPAGSVYFGGTDPGRGLPTAFCKSHADADPFFTLTQNALADATYLEYMRNTYGERAKLLADFIKARRSDSRLQALDAERRNSMETLASLYAGHGENDPEVRKAREATGSLGVQIDDITKGILADLQSRADASKKPGLSKEQDNKSLYIPTDQDLHQCFQDYLVDAQRRLQEDKLKPSENVKQVNGAVQVSGQVAVMSINGLMAKVIFDKNPDRDFYIEESFPLDWMYPYLEPHGLIMKIDQQPLSELSDETVRRDREYWSSRAAGMIGGWLNAETPVQAVAAFVEKTWVRKDLEGFTGDRRFVESGYAQRSFSKWRSSVAGLYAWRMEHAAGAEERERMAREADFAFRQAWALCPYSPEAVFRYVNFLMAQDRGADALLVAETAAEMPSMQGKDGEQLRNLVSQLQKFQKAK